VTSRSCRARHCCTLGFGISVRHIYVVRTTVDIAEHVLIEAKQMAARRRLSLARLIEDSLRKYLADEPRGPVTAKRHRLRLMDGGAPLPGVDLTDTSDLLER
jgi:hypothetical protein